MSVNITFLGGTGTVTDSKYLVRRDGKCLLVGWRALVPEHGSTWPT